jgi:hypothetical protein
MMFWYRIYDFTDYAFNVSNSQLDRYIGEIKSEDIEGILNMHFYEYGAGYKEQSYKSASKVFFLMTTLDLNSITDLSLKKILMI